MKHEADMFSAAVEEASKALFKRRYRLSVIACIALAEDDAVYAREVAVRLGIADNQVAPDFVALRSIAALELVESSDREAWHLRVEHPVWSFSKAMLEVVAENQAPGHATELLRVYRVEFLGLGA